MNTAVQAARSKVIIVPQGYLVTLGNGSLDAGDSISGGLVTYTTSQIIGAGNWVWSGTAGGTTYTNQLEPGVFELASNGNVYFIPDYGPVTTISSASANNPPTYVSADGTIDGTSGNDVIDVGYTDSQGDAVTGGNDTIDAAGGNDTVFGGGGNDSIDGGTGADFIVGDQTQANDGMDAIAGGDGNDVIYGDTAAGTDNSPTFVSWANQGLADETSIAGGTTATSADGNINIDLTVLAEQNFYGASVETGDALFNYNGASDTSSLAIEGGDIPTGGTLGNNPNAATITLDFSAAEAGYSDEVSDVTFGIFDIDELQNQFIDQITVTAYDADGNIIPVTVTLGSTTTLTLTTNADGSQTVSSIVSSGGSGATNAATGFAEFYVAGPVSYIEIDYNNTDPAYGGHAIRIGDVELTPIPETPEDGNADTISGDAGDDLIYGQGGDDIIYGGTGFDTAYGGAGNDSLFGFGDNDTLFGGDGNDYVDGDGGNDSLSGDSGADTIVGDAGNDSISGGTGDDEIYAGDDNDTVYGGADNDTVFLGAGDDTFGDWSTDAGNDTIHGEAGNDAINGGEGDDTLYGGDDNDTLTGASGNDVAFGGQGSDTFNVTDDHETIVITGGEDVGDTDIDSIGFYNFETNQGVTVTSTGNEAGTFAFDAPSTSSGITSSGTFAEIEELNGTFYDDTFNMAADNSGVSIDANEGEDVITTGSGDDIIEAGSGADTVNAGAGDDFIGLAANSTPDGDQDVIILQDGFGNDTVLAFDAPTPGVGNTFVGIDTFDVTNLTDGTDPVNVNDVTVTDTNGDGTGDAILTFPNGESITLIGIDPATADNPFWLNAIGIPLSDGTVEGTSGADTINNSYIGDPDGDMVDAGDAILPGDGGDDDLIYGYGGNDNIYSGFGNDEVYGGDGDDLLQDSSGNSTLDAGIGNDTIYSGSGNDTVYGGDGDDLVGASIGSDEVYGGAGNDTLSAGGFAGAGDTLDGGDGNDTILSGLGNDTIFGGTGDDSITVASSGGTDTIDGGEDIGDGDIDTLTFTDANGPAGVDVTMTGNEAGTYSFAGETGTGSFTNIEQVILTDQNDSFNGLAVTESLSIDGADGDDSIFGSTTDDILLGGDGDDTISGGSGDDTLYGGAGADTLSGGSDQDVIYGGAGDVIDGSETGVDNDTLIVSGVDYIDYDTNPENGIVYFNGGGSLTFTNIENVIVSDRDGTVSGTAGDDTIDVGYTGDPDGDVVDGNDAILVGDTGNDDLIEAGAGNDTVLAGDGDDEIYAGTGDDSVRGGLGNDTIFGGDGADLINVDSGLDTVFGGAGDDTIYGSIGNSTLYGGADNDLLDGQFDDNEIYGGDGDDTIYVQEFADSNIIEGGEDAGGGDIDEVRFFEDTSLQGVTVTFTGDEAADFDFDGSVSTGSFTEIEAVRGTNFDDTIDASASTVSQTINGAAGDDTLTGGDGADTITGGADQDVIYGGAGDVIDGSETGVDNDTLVVEGVDYIDYDTNPENGIVYFTGGGSLTFTNIENVIVSDRDGTVSGTAGDDLIDASYTGDPDGDVVDGNDAILVGDTGNDDLIEAGAGNDTVLAGDGDDEIYAQDGNDTVFGGAGNDYIESWTGDDVVYGGDGNDTMDGATGSDTLFGDAGDDFLMGGNDVATDTLYGGSGNDTLWSGAGDDTLSGGTGDDNIDGQAGDDIIVLEDGFGNDNITGGETGETFGDFLDASAATTNLTLDLSTLQPFNPEMGTLTDGVSTASFQQIEYVFLGSGDDSVTGSAGDDRVATNLGQDTINLGAGDDQLDLGQSGGGGDGDADVVILQDGSGNDTIYNFDAPTPNVGGTFDGTDTFDVSNLHDTGGSPVNTNDVTVSDDGSGNAVLTFPNGESVTLIGISPVAADDPFYLNAIGIPLPDGTVSGTAGNDLIDASYTGDLDGDMVDAGDAILAGDTGDDDLIEAGAGNDTVLAGAGDDEVYGGTGNDTINGGTGDDALYGGDDNDTFLVEDNFGADTIVGGQNGTNFDTIDLSALSNPVTVLFTGPGAGTITDTVTGDIITFSEIEQLILTNQSDLIDATLDDGYTNIQTLEGDDIYQGSNGDDFVDEQAGALDAAGNDTFYGGAGNDTFYTGNDADVLYGGTGSDTLNGQGGNDTIYFSEGDSVRGGADDDLIVYEDLGETTNGEINITGGINDEVNGDTLQLGSSAILTQDVIDTFVDDGTGSFSGTITMDDGTILNFTEIENIICFTPGTRIATAKGLVAVEDLEIGDMVVTRDHGLQPIRWVEGRTVPGIDRFAPVRIRKGVLAGQERDLVVSPQHRVLFQGYRAELLFGESEVLASAKHLVDGMDVTQDERHHVTYVHMLFDQHEIIFAEGAATESFHPGDIGFSAVGDEAREELFTLFPQLRADQNAYGCTARRCLKAHEAKLILN